MLDALSDKLRKVLKDLRGQGSLSEANISEVLKEVRLALLEADVNFKIVKDFIARVREKALGKEVLESLTPGQQFTKIVHDELTGLFGGADAALELKGSPSVVMFVGLQGSGKTTTTAKLALQLKAKGRNPFIVPADLFRLAAVLQLKRLAQEIKVDCFDSEAFDSPLAICTEALRVAGLKGYDTLLVDTAGRLHIDTGLMDELKTLKGVLKPSEILFVADSMTGQDAVNTAKAFGDVLPLTGIILTKLDGDARGGAALSVRQITGKPIKFVGVSEKLNGLEAFHPERMASRVLGMGDVLSLIEEAQRGVDHAEAEKLAKKVRKGEGFDLNDFKMQIVQMRKMGGVSALMDKLPAQLSQAAASSKVDDRQITRVEGIINSMTPLERSKPELIKASRKRRIATGAGVQVMHVNQLLKQFEQTQKMMKMLGKGGGMAKLMRGMAGKFPGMR